MFNGVNVFNIYSNDISYYSNDLEHGGAEVGS